MTCMAKDRPGVKKDHLEYTAPELGGAQVWYAVLVFQECSHIIVAHVFSVHVILASVWIGCGHTLFWREKKIPLYPYYLLFIR